MQKRIVILASGAGSNADQIIAHFNGGQVAQVVALISDRKASGALSIARAAGVSAMHIPYREMSSGGLATALKELKPDLIVLAGFLRKIPDDVITAHSDSIINVHPSLLPAYGGPGMYGNYVHEAVIAGRETQSGISIHLVNEEYDKGAMIAQFYCQISPDDDVVKLRSKVQALEHRYFSMIIEKVLEL